VTEMKGNIYTTAHKTDLKLAKTGELAFGEFKQPLETEIDVLVDPNKQFQTLMGIGAALTDAAAETFYKLSDENQEKFLEAYYDKEKGIGYSLGRTIIHSCDFSTGSYTYVEEGDAELKTFNIDHDRQYRLPFTKQAIAAVRTEVEAKLNRVAGSGDPEQIDLGLTPAAGHRTSVCTGEGLFAG
ncbi:MAG: hypothetical protein GY771_12765, partial [bacterium]|nr:hypothetical protein [bacterium]